MNKRSLAIAFILSFPLFAYAQQEQKLRDRDPDLAAAKKLAADLQQANFHRGPFYLFSRFRVSDAGYTEGNFVPAGSQSGGLSLSVEAPHRLYFVPRKKVIFSAEVIPGYSFFEGGNNQFNYSARGDAHFLLNHLYLNLYGSTADQLRAHVADINRLATTREDEIGAAGEIKYSSRTSALFTVRSRETSYPEDRFQPDPDPEPQIAIQALNRKENNVRLSFNHKTFPRTSLFLAGEGSKYDFTEVERYASKRTYVGGGFAYDGGMNQLRVEAGPMKLDYDDPSVPDYDGITAQIRASRGAGRWTFTAGADRDLGFSIFLDNPYYIATSGFAGADYTATRTLTLHLRTAAERDEYETPVFGRSRTDDISFSSVGFTYGVRRVRLGADVGWYERDSTAFGDTDSGIRYVFRLSLIP